MTPLEFEFHLIFVWANEPALAASISVQPIRYETRQHA